MRYIDPNGESFGDYYNMDSIWMGNDGITNQGGENEKLSITISAIICNSYIYLHA